MSFLTVACFVAVFVGISIAALVRTVEHAAQLEAQHVAELIADGALHGGALRRDLLEYVRQITSLHQRDIVIVGPQKLGVDRIAAGETKTARLQQYLQRVHQSGQRLLELLNPTRIHQVLANLLSNTLKFSPPESVVDVELSSVQMKDGRPAVQVSVSDQGVGIPGVELDRVFDKFIQSSRTASGSGGTGLGLSICRQIVLDHGGEVWAASRDTRGARMSFLLPLDDAEDVTTTVSLEKAFFEADIERASA